MTICVCGCTARLTELSGAQMTMQRKTRNSFWRHGMDRDQSGPKSRVVQVGVFERLKHPSHKGVFVGGQT